MIRCLAIKRDMPFQSTLPCGSDYTEQYNRWYGLLISIHAPLRERPQTYFVIISQPDFNPRSLAGATLVVMAFSRFIKISIHAPLRERPNKLAEAEAIYAISIHAPLRERRRLRHLEDSTTRISIHAPLRERHLSHYVAHVANQISIHAPLRERLFITPLFVTLILFQSTLPCGSDGMMGMGLAYSFLFQSTLPCGSDRSSGR